MEFRLNEYHRNIPDEELINDVINTARNLGVTSLTVKKYSQNGNFHSSTLIRRFGSWKKVLTLCHLDLKNHSFRVNASNDDIIKDVIRVKNIYKKDTITRQEYDAYGVFRGGTLFRHGMTWNQILQMCGLELNENRNISNENIFAEIERLWIKLGRQPTTTDIKNGASIYSLNTFSRRFGSWRKALVAFIDYVNADESQDHVNNGDRAAESVSNVQNGLKDSCERSVAKHKTQREPNLRLRFKVLSRDNFRCCICGASPSTDSTVKLHIDHIVPWSKGGETVLENLRTLCSKCNLGKSDLL